MDIDATRTEGTGREVVLHLLAPPGSDSEEAEFLTSQLRRELLELDVDDVTALSSAQLPAGAKGDPETLGALLVSLTGAGGMLTTIIVQVGAWLARRRDGSQVSIAIGEDSLVLTNTSLSERRELIETFLRRHGETSQNG